MNSPSSRHPIAATQYCVVERGPDPFEKVNAWWEPELVRMAAKHRAPHCRRRDIVQAGRVALWRAHSRYDPGRGVSFEHYARRAIKRAMLREVEATCPRSAKPGCWSTADPEADPKLRDPVDRRTQACLLQRIAAREWIATLPSNLQRVYEALFERGLTQTTAAQEIGVSQVRVSQLRREILDRGRTELLDLAA